MSSIFQDFGDYDGCEPIGAALPEIIIDEKYYAELNLDKDCTNIDFLKALCRRGIEEKGINKLSNKKEYYDQIKYELEIFEETGLVDYILALWDIVNFAKEENITIGAGRGSAPSSSILYLIGVTKIDPIYSKLIFERFVSRTRVKKVGVVDGVTYFDGGLLADVDLDFDYSRRHEAIEYIEGKYKGRTAKILTFNTFSSKLCIKEAVKYFDLLKEEEAAIITDSVPKKHGIVSSLSDSANESDKFKRWSERNPYTFEISLKIEGLIKNTGIHPSGIAICSQSIDNVCPLQLTKDGNLITAYEMNDVADLMVKFDILGLRTIAIANKACEKVGLNIDDIDDEDAFIYEVLQNFNHPTGLFQISAETNFRVAQEVKPENLNELSDVIALARPGALAFVGEYIKQKKSPYLMGLNEDLDDILSRSKNVLLYQESMMEIIHRVFKLPKEDAELARKVIGKKLTDKIAEWEKKIYDAAELNNVPEEVAKYVWKAMEASANYSFNLCLSPDSVVETKTGDKCLFELSVGEEVLAYGVEDGEDHFVEVVDIIEGEREIFEFEFEDNRKIKCSMDHKFLCSDRKMRPIREILYDNLSIVCN